MTECNQTPFHFANLFQREVVAGFDGGTITSEAGSLLLRQVEQRTGIVRQFANCFQDYRDADKPRTTVLPTVEVVSVYPMTARAMRQLSSLALSDPSVQQALQREGKATFVAHVLPRDYGMIGMFADVGTQHMTPGNIRLSRFKYLCGWLLPFLDSHMRTDLMGSDGQEYQVVFSRVDGPDGQPVPSCRLFDLSAKMTPVYVANVNAATRQVSRTIDPPRRSFWGDVKMPIF